MLFEPNLYVCEPGAGVGLMKIDGSSYSYPLSSDAPSPTWRTPPKDDRRVHSRRFVVRLGPARSSREWYSHDVPFTTLLAMRCDRAVSDAADHGFTVLDLAPLAGEPARLWAPRNSYHPPVGGRPKYDPPADAAWLVGLALAEAWTDVAYGQRAVDRRLCVVGPDWAIDVLAAMPGVVVHDGRHADEGTCEAWGRRWTMRNGRRLTAYDVAMRLSGPTKSWGAEEQAYGDVATMAVNGHACRACRASQSEDRWEVDLPTVGVVELRGDAGHLHRPHAGDEWLVKRVGDGEPIEAKRSE